MRTTISLNEDVSQLLDDAVQETGISFKQAVNQFLLLGLAAAKKRQATPFVIKPLSFQLPPGLSYDNVGHLLEELEGQGR